MSKKFSWFGLKKDKQTTTEHTTTETADAPVVDSTPTKTAAQPTAPETLTATSAETAATSAETPTTSAGTVELTAGKTATSAEKVEPSAEIQQPLVENIAAPIQGSETNIRSAEQTADSSSIPPQEKPDAENEVALAVEQKSSSQPNKVKQFFGRLKQGLVKTSENIGSGVANLFLGKKIDDELFEELETHLLMADVGMDTTIKITNLLTEHANRKQLKDADALYDVLKSQLTDMLVKVEQPLQLQDQSPYVILMVGVNGVGKTTTIGKLVKKFQQQGKSVMLAAGDTFRSAAVEQLQVWGERNEIPVIAQHTGADSASVIFDAVQAAQARGVDVLIADTAGRLQNKDNLMEELKKIVRVMKKLDGNAPHEIMLTLDAATGQNAVSQTKLFNQAVGVTGINLTKLDGTAKGGIIFAIADQFSIPIRYIGVGEAIDDLREFNSGDFIEALFDSQDKQQQ